MRKHSTLLLCLSFLLCLCACSAKQEILSTQTLPAASVSQSEQAQINERWANFVANMEQEEFAAYGHANSNQASGKAHFSLVSSLRIKNTKTSHRIILRAWGEQNLPIRIDIEAGVGVSIASVLRERDFFTVYSPQEKRAKVYAGTAEPLFAHTLPVAFSVQDVANLLNGRYAPLFPKNFAHARLVSGGEIVYTLTANDKRAETGQQFFEQNVKQSHPHPQKQLNGRLTLDAFSRPVLWEGTKKGEENGEALWTIRFLRYPEEHSASLPMRYDMTAQDASAIFYIKSRTYPQNAFSAQDMNVTLPVGTYVDGLLPPPTQR